MPCRAADSDISIAEQIKAMRETYYQLTHTIIEEIEQPKYVCTERFCMYGYPIVLCEYPQQAVLYGYPIVLCEYPQQAVLYVWVLWRTL